MLMDISLIAMIEQITTAGCIDATAITLIVVFCIAGSVRGLAGECGRFLALASGIATILLLYPLLKSNIFTGSELPWKVLSMVGAILVAAIVGLLVNFLTKKFFRIIVGQPADAIIGAIVSMLTTAIAIVVACFFLYSLPNERIQKNLFQDSMTGRLSEPLILYAKNKMSQL